MGVPMAQAMPLAAPVVCLSSVYYFRSQGVNLDRGQSGKAEFVFALLEL